MRALAFAVATLLLSAACSDNFDHALKELERLRDRMCECRNKACADRVLSRVTDWESDLADRIGAKEPTGEQLTRQKKIDEELSRCQEKFAM